MGPAKQRPVTDAQHLGIEFEFDLPSKEAFETLKGLVASDACLQNRVQIHNEIITLAAPLNKQKAYEATLLYEESDFERPLSELLNYIQAVDGFVDKRCGLHVHIDVRYRTREVIMKRLRSVEGELFDFCADWRQHHPECASGYMSVMKGRNNYGTIEVRCMEANFEFSRIRAYIQFLVDVANNVESQVYAA